jgi:hypothetical protein
MKRIMALLTFCGISCLVIYARDMQQDGKAAQCSVESVDQMKQDVDRAQSRCEYAKDDPYEDVICERSEMQIRRKRKALEQCSGQRDQGIQRFGNEE